MSRASLHPWSIVRQALQESANRDPFHYAHFQTTTQVRDLPLPTHRIHAASQVRLFPDPQIAIGSVRVCRVALQTQPIQMAIRALVSSPQDFLRQAELRVKLPDQQ